MTEECFKIDGVAIAAPETYKPVFSTTSTKSTKRDQTLTMHNSVMGKDYGTGCSYRNADADLYQKS